MPFPQSEAHMNNIGLKNGKVLYSKTFPSLLIKKHSIISYRASLCGMHSVLSA